MRDLRVDSSATDVNDGLHSLWALPTRLALGKFPRVADVEPRMAELEDVVASASEVQSRAVPTEEGMKRPGT